MHLHLWIPTIHADALRAVSGLGRDAPVAVATSAHPEGVVIAVSASAQRLGAHRGMRLREARMRCPGVALQVQDPAVSLRTQSAIAAMCAAVSSATSGDAERWDLDLADGPLPPPPAGATGWSDARSIARALARACRLDLGLDAWAGVGGSIGEARLAARLAHAQGDPRAVAALPPECDERVDGLPLSWLPDLPARAAQRLRKDGIASIGALRQLDGHGLDACLGRYAPLAAAAALIERSPIIPGRADPGPTLAQGAWCGVRGADPARAAVLLGAAGTALADDLESHDLACAQITLHARWIDPCGRSRVHCVRHRFQRDLSALAPALARIDGVPVRWERFDLVASGLHARRAVAALPSHRVEDALAAVA